MSTHSQMLKGVLEMCILAIIEKKETYGYEITEKLAFYGFTFVSEGSIYPVLLRLQKDNLVEATLHDSPLGPKRKYYHLTETGRGSLKGAIKLWGELSIAVNRIISESEGKK